MTPLLIVFVAATVAWTVLELVLSLRQTRHVAAHRDRVPADFAGTVTLDEHRKAADYTAARERLSRFETLAEALLPLFWALGGIDLLYGALARTVPPSLGRGVLFFLVTGLVGTLVGLPFALVRAFGIEARFGFNKVTPALFVVDRLKGAALSLLFTVPLLYALLFAMGHFAGLWWLWTWAGLLVIMVAAPSVFVRLIAPRFNRFEPLADADLRGRIETLLARSGFTASGLFTMDASRRSTHGNAYFIGFGRAKRIVLFDTLIARSTPEEIEAVVAHELGHFKHRHVIFGLARAALMLLVTLAAFGWLARQPWLLPAFGVHARSDALSLYRLSAAQRDRRPARRALRQLDFAQERIRGRRLRPPRGRRRPDGRRVDAAVARQRLHADAGPLVLPGAPFAPAGAGARQPPAQRRRDMTLLSASRRRLPVPRGRFRRRRAWPCWAPPTASRASAPASGRPRARPCSPCRRR